MKTYNWQQSDWPHFRYDLSALTDTLFLIAEKSGLLRGKLTHLAKNQQTDAMIDVMEEEAIKSSEIEGEYLNRPDVRSSIKNKLGLNTQPARVHDKRAQGFVEMMFDLRAGFSEELTEAKLFDWHLALMSGTSNPHLSIGRWRTHEEPMEVVSGHSGNWVVHFQAPPSRDVSQQMEKFILWFNNSAPGQAQEIKSAAVRAAIAHLYFESIHPFEDGNGRIGRAISEKALFQGFGYPALLSLSQVIEANRNDYYEALNQGSCSNEITCWISYFIKVILEAQIEAEKQINFVLRKSVFLNTYENQFNERQMKVVKRMLEAGIKGFEGGMSARKYMIITGASKATATRDLQNLHEKGAMEQVGGGRSVRYDIKLS